MRTYTIIFLLLISLSMAAQKNKYRYEYKFTVSDPTMEPKMEFKQEPAEMSVPTLRGVIKDNESNPVPFATLQFISLDSLPLRSATDIGKNAGQSLYEYYTQADSEGGFIFTGKPGRYQLKVTSINGPGATGNFELHIHELLKTNITLPVFRMPTTYNIRSKKKLNKAVIESIKKCVEDSWQKKNGKAGCEKKDEYYITFDI